MASDMFKHSRLPVTDQQISQASLLTDSSVKPIMTSNGNNTIQQTSAAEPSPTMTQTLSTGQKKRVGVFHVFFCFFGFSCSVFVIFQITSVHI